MDQRNKPFNIKVKSGDKKAFCACLMTKNPPFCDASHKTTDKKPIRVEFEDDKTVRICGCSKSGTFPYCDGSHKETT
ncbi:MAG: CDGSH iron-sulfur domain-containing protein [Deltaproteobacteria bacterium]|nr:CDGSH iron-sulfur domain-containing protein [Deltaproteobacteria bacterium]